MAEEAKVPTLSPALSDRNCSRKSPAPDSSPSTSQDASQQQCPSIHPSTAPVVMPLQNPDQSGHGPGLYAIPTFLPFMGIMSGSPPSTLIPLTYKIPTHEAILVQERPTESSEAGRKNQVNNKDREFKSNHLLEFGHGGGGGQGLGGGEQRKAQEEEPRTSVHPREEIKSRISCEAIGSRSILSSLIQVFLSLHLGVFIFKKRANSTGTAGEVQGQEARQQQGPQRQVVVRRFHFAIQLDLALIIKLAAVVFLFSQEGSRQRFILLVLFASFIYLYQTGALAPLLRWIRRGGAHPQPHPAIRPEQRPLVHVDGNQPLLEGNLQVENDNQLAQNGLPPAEVVDENQPALLRRDGNQRWGILKEIQMFVIGFITSLLPGFHHHND